jgi:hypothetical protein
MEWIDIIKAKALETLGYLREDVKEMHETFDKQKKRLFEIIEKQMNEPVGHDPSGCIESE